MASAADALPPGGRLVILRPFSVLPRRRPDVERQRVHAVAPTGRWLAWPGGPGEPVRRWIPAGSAAATEWLRDEVTGSTRLVGRQRLRWLAWRVLRRIGALPDATVALRVDDATPGSRLDDLVARSGRAVGIEPGPPILLAHGLRPENKVVLLVGARGAARPALAVKITRDAAWNGRLEHEAGVLESLASAGLGPGDGVPSIVAKVELEDGALAVAETALVGPRLAGATRRIGFAAAAADGAAWLTRLAAATARPPNSIDPRLAVAGGILDRLAVDFAGVVEVSAARRSRLLDAIADLPVVAEHRDTAPWNLLDTSAGGASAVGAVDWESSETAGWPGLDLAYLLVQLAIEAARARTPEAQLAAARRLWDPSDPFGAVAAAETEHYAAALGLDVADLIAIRPLAWAIHAASEYRRAVDDHGARPPAAILADGLYVRLWAADT